MKKTIAYSISAGVLFVAALQLLRPSIPAPVEKSEIVAPLQATKVLRTSCYSCHSNELRLSWFDEVVPGYWLVRHDILDARQHLNFSTLGTKPAAAQRAALFEAVNMAALGSMPLKSFSALHPDARVIAADLNQLEEFLAPWRDTPPHSPEPTQLAAPIVAVPTASGLSFDSQYTAWHFLSVTDRGDNNTFRLILGNGMAVQALRDGRVSPWPDGARFAKVAWQQRSTSEGVIEPGEFVQIEMMVKNATAYRSSNGWGWGRWKSAELKPYGENSHVVEECTGCHAPMRRNDFVYTMPVANVVNPGDQLNGKAAIMPKLPFDPFTATPVTMYVDRSQRTVSVLFERSGHPGGGKDPLLITWNEQDDPHWFGARIPGDFAYAEYVHSSSSSPVPVYTRIVRDGSTDNTVDTLTAQNRMHFIEQLKLAPYLTH
jgi:hypothetical protein